MFMRTFIELWLNMSISVHRISENVKKFFAPSARNNFTQIIHTYFHSSHFRVARASSSSSYLFAFDSISILLVQFALYHFQNFDFVQETVVWASFFGPQIPMQFWNIEVNDLIVYVIEALCFFCRTWVIFQHFEGRQRKNFRRLRADSYYI